MKVKYWGISALVLVILAALIVAPAAAAGSVTRSLDQTTVTPGSTVTVTLTPSSDFVTSPGWGVTETVPTGLSYVAGSSDADGTTDLGSNQYRFTRLGGSGISYQISVPSSAAEGTYTIAGTWTDGDKVTGTVGGTTTLTVSTGPTPTTTVTPSGASRTISTSGTTVFVNEHDLDLTPIGAVTSLRKFTDDDRTKALVKQIPVSNAARFDVLPSLADGVTGVYYAYSGSTYLGAYVIIEAPTLTLDAVLASDHTSSIADDSITKDNKIDFAVESNVGPLWADDSGNPARIKIEITTPGGGKTYEMGGVTLTNQNLDEAKEYIGTVDPAGEAAGEYSAVAKWQYPTGFSDWADNSNTVTFSIITKPVTITANKDSVIRSNPFVVTIQGQSDTPYYVYIKSASLNSNQYPKLQPDQPGVNRSAAAMTQIAASSIGNEVSGYQDTEAIVTTKADGTRPIQFNTTDNTKDREFTVKVAKVGDETQKYDTVKVKVEKGSVTVAYEGTGSYYLGEELTLTGTNSDSDTTYLFMTGPNLAANGVRLDDIDTAATTGFPGTFNTVTVESDDTWEFKWDTSAITGGTIDSGTYTIYAVSDDLNKADLSGSQYATASVIIKKPFVNAQANTATLAKGDKLIVTGSAQGDPTSVYVWIFGKNYRTLFQSESVESDGSFEYELDRAATDVMSAGQYFVVVQHPMQNGQPDVIGEPTIVGAGKWINATWVGGSSELNVEVSQLQASESANVLIDLLNKPQSDDTYRKLTFMVEEPWIRIDTVGTKTIGDSITLSGTTNLAEGDEILVDVTSASFKPTDKTQAEEFSGASGTVTVEKGAEFNTWSFSIGDTSQWKADEYIVKIESIDTDASATTTFNVVEVPPTTAAPPTTAPPTTAPPTTVPPTTATPTPPSPGFGALVALIGLGAVAVLVLRRH